MGATGCFSFYPTKHITTMEGGMLTTDDDDIAWRVRKQRAFGYDKGLGDRTEPGIYDVIMLGYNFRMSEAQAAIGLGQLDRLEEFLTTRRRNAEALCDRLDGIEGITTFPLERGPARSACYCVNAVLPEGGPAGRSAVVRQLNEAGVGTSVHYPVALPMSRYYRERYDCDPGDFPVARWISDNAISLPVGPHLDTDDMRYIADRLAEAMAANRN
jgi:dTDP-4-amino-4,6-dideoxygalactose transaminase